MTSTFTAKDVTSITHEPKKAQHTQSRTEIQKCWSACTCMAAYAHFSNKQKDTQTSESKGLTFANGINPNKETSCFLEHNTAKLLCGEQAVNTHTHTQPHVHAPTHTRIHQISSLYITVHVFPCRVPPCPAMPLAVPSSVGARDYLCWLPRRELCVHESVCVCLRDGKEGGRADDRVGFSDSLECEAAFTALSEQPE